MPGHFRRIAPSLRDRIIKWFGDRSWISFDDFAESGLLVATTSLANIRGPPSRAEIAPVRSASAVSTSRLKLHVFHRALLRGRLLRVLRLRHERRTRMFLSTRHESRHRSSASRFLRQRRTHFSASWNVRFARQRSLPWSSPDSDNFFNEIVELNHSHPYVNSCASPHTFGCPANYLFGSSQKADLVTERDPNVWGEAQELTYGCEWFKFYDFVEEYVGVWRTPRQRALASEAHNSRMR